MLHRVSDENWNSQVYYNSFMILIIGILVVSQYLSRTKNQRPKIGNTSLRAQSFSYVTAETHTKTWAGIEPGSLWIVTRRLHQLNHLRAFLSFLLFL